MKRNTRYVAALATLLAALAVGCAESTAPHQDSPCLSGGGTGTWDRCGDTATTTMQVVDTGAVHAVKP